ncbi:MAG: ABC transporter permease [Chitinivibrionales bacterium]
MKSVYFIALNTLKETIRNKVLYNILFIAILAIYLSISFGEWSVFARTKVIQDFGLATMSLSGLLLAIFIGVGMLGKELESKTVYQLASKPVRRSSIILGKFAGLCITLLLNFLLLTLFFLGVLLAIGGSVEPDLLTGILLSGCELAVIISIAVFFSTVTNSTVSAFLTLAVYIAGHFNDLMEISMIAQKNVFHAFILKIIYYIIPNLEHFNIRSNVVYNIPLPSSYIPFALLYAFLFTALFLTLACAVFSRKDL